MVQRGRWAGLPCAGERWRQRNEAVAGRRGQGRGLRVRLGAGLSGFFLEVPALRQGHPDEAEMRSGVRGPGCRAVLSPVLDGLPRVG